LIYDHRIIRSVIGTPADEATKVIVYNALYSVLGALIGCGLFDIISFHKYVAVMKNFEKEHVWGYFFAPWMAAALGVVIYGLLKTGLLVFTGSVTNDNVDTARLGYLTIGFLSGFGWFKLIGKIKKIIDELFGSYSSDSKGGITKAIKEDSSSTSVELSNISLTTKKAIVEPSLDDKSGKS
jgi:hypothetical protein